MNKLRTTVLLGMSILLLAACSSEQAPVGRWEGFHESGEWILAIRLQVEPGNVIRATALSVDVAGTSAAEHARNAKTIRRALPVQWETATRGEVDFRSNTLTRKHGNAPLFVYEPADGSMTFHFYAFGKLTRRVHLDPVKEFTGPPRD
jgi:hypothetical protein